jgi:hypothetical protein
MAKKEFYAVAIIIVYAYLAFIFHINLNNYINFQKDPNSKFTFNIFEFN